MPRLIIPIAAQQKSQYCLKAAWGSPQFLDLGAGHPIRQESSGSP